MQPLILNLGTRLSLGIAPSVLGIGYGLDEPWLKSRQVLRFISSPKLPDRLGVHITFHSMGTQVATVGLKLTTHPN